MTNRKQIEEAQTQVEQYKRLIAHWQERQEEGIEEAAANVQSAKLFLKRAQSDLSALLREKAADDAHAKSQRRAATGHFVPRSQQDDQGEA